MSSINTIFLINLIKYSRYRSRNYNTYISLYIYISEIYSHKLTSKIKSDIYQLVSNSKTLFRMANNLEIIPLAHFVS